MDPEYLAYLEEMNELNFQSLKTKVAWETHRMLYKIKAKGESATCPNDHAKR